MILVNKTANKDEITNPGSLFHVDCKGPIMCGGMVDMALTAIYTLI